MRSFNNVSLKTIKLNFILKKKQKNYLRLSKRKSPKSKIKNP